MTGPAGRPPTRAVIFDLDGTLVQTRVASWEVFSRISERFELGVTRPEEYFDLFRGNVFASIRELCRDDDHAAEVKEAFLELLRSDYTPPLVPGIVHVVRRLAAECTLAVMSSNAMAVLRRVLVTNDIAFCFAHAFGGDVAPDKRAAIRSFLVDTSSGFGRRCVADYDEEAPGVDPGPASTVLVTDTAGDVRDALEAGIRVIGVAWGMHSVDELTAAGAEFVALWPQEVSSYLLGDSAAEEPPGACSIRSAPVTGPDPATRAAPAGDCGCGCTTGTAPHGSSVTGHDQLRNQLQEAGRRRRVRRRAAASSSGVRLEPGPAPATRNEGAAAAEMLAALHRICGRA